MNFPPLIRGRFLRRDNRFRATVTIGEDEVWAHIPNSGRLQELFQPTRPVWLSKASSENRITAYDLKLVEYAGELVSVDARLPNDLFAEALENGLLPEFSYPTIKREVTVGKSRLDFQLSAGNSICWLETKSVTLVEEGAARFPDAPTDRGRRHLEELVELKSRGDRASVVFVVQRPDARKFLPNSETDPDFAAALFRAASVGVEVMAYRCHTSLTKIVMADKIPIILTEF